MISNVNLLFGNKGILAKDTLFRLENEYGIVMMKEESEDVEKMCNWSVYKYQQGYEDGCNAAYEKAYKDALQVVTELRNNEIVMNLLKESIPESVICKTTGITKEKLTELKQQIAA